jgi:OOP family OmpA-OmpF porin
MRISRKYQTVFLKAMMLSIVLLFSAIDYAQVKKGKNLIPNPSFEDHKGKGADIKTALPWKGIGTVDYYLKPDKRDTSPHKGARTGVGYAGLRFQSDYKEYMYAKLNETLEKGKLYHFKMYIRLLESDNVTVTVKQLGAYFSPTQFYVGMEFSEEGLVDTTYNKGISGTLDWILIQGDYTAHGNEQYIIIGNFRTKMRDDFVKKNKWSLFEFKEAYYYIDDLSLRETITIDSSAHEGMSGESSWIPYDFSAGQTFEIKNIFFEAGTSRLLETSYPALDDLAKAFQNHPTMEIQVNGHIDKFGTEEEEKRISKERAKAVYDYLKSKGVTNVMIFRGLGSTQPIAPNSSEEFKVKNRRVEIVITKK